MSGTLQPNWNNIKYTSVDKINLREDPRAKKRGPSSYDGCRASPPNPSARQDIPRHAVRRKGVLCCLVVLDRTPYILRGSRCSSLDIVLQVSIIRRSLHR